MAWTEFTRRRYERIGGKYASDATDAERALAAPPTFKYSNTRFSHSSNRASIFLNLTWIKFAVSVPTYS